MKRECGKELASNPSSLVMENVRGSSERPRSGESDVCQRNFLYRGLGQKVHSASEIASLEKETSELENG